MDDPFTKTWWIVENQLLGGPYPGAVDPHEQERILTALLDLGIQTFISLQQENETERGTTRFPDYRPTLHRLAKERGLEASFRRFPIRDQSAVAIDTLVSVLDYIDEQRKAGHKIYVHCWGGNGRTGTVAGCWLVRHGRSAEQAFQEMSHSRSGRGFRFSAPENDRQRELVKSWHKLDPQLSKQASANAKLSGAATTSSLAVLTANEMTKRAAASLLGLALGDAVGTSIEFKAPGDFTPLTDMMGGGPFHLEAGQWTDDTSMALCLAESLIECSGFDPHDQMQRYCKWWQNGHFSVKGYCFDIGGTTCTALSHFEKTGKAYSGPTKPQSAGNGSLMRLSPVPIAYAQKPSLAIALAGESSRSTHGATECIDACRYFAGLLVGLINGDSKETVLAEYYAPIPGLWEQEPLAPKIAAIAAGSFKDKNPPEIRGRGYVVDCLEAALWAFYRTDNFRDAVLAAANLGDDADTTAAVCGQVAGACYGTDKIPQGWLEKLAMHNTIKDLAAKLIELW